MNLKPDGETAALAFAISSIICLTVLSVWCAVTGACRAPDWRLHHSGWFLPIREADAVETEETDLGHSTGHGMTRNKMLNPPYRMTRIGADMQSYSAPLRMQRMDSGGRTSHAAGKDAFEGEGR